ncbi:MAG: serpin family protein [bacterium]
MKKMLVFLFVILFVLKSTGGYTFESDKSSQQKMVASNNYFALSFYKHLSKGKNIFYSPYSLYSAMLMIYGGAEGETKSEMEKKLRIRLDIKDLYSVSKDKEQQLLALGQEEGYKINLANAFWSQKGYEFKKEYLELIQSNYTAKISSVDFWEDKEEACRVINSWVEEKTERKIKELITPELIKKHLTTCVLTNAVYFQGDWKLQFDKENTEEEYFYSEKEKKDKILMMKQKENFPYFSNDKFKVIELPYSQNRMKMLVFLPDKKYGLAKLENYLTPEKLKEIQSNMENEKINLHFPRFEIKSDLELEKELTKYGLETMFDRNAGFSGISEEVLFITDVLQKSFVVVDEKGSEATASSGIIVSRKGLPLDFFVNRPFLFLILTEQTEEIIFMGRFTGYRS